MRTLASTTRLYVLPLFSVFSLYFFPAAVLAVTATPANDFLNSIGVDSSINSRGETLAKTIECAKYGGFRWMRGGGIENPSTTQNFVDLYRQTGVRVTWSLASGWSDLNKLISTAKQLIAIEPNAILCFEGNNEPNNWKITYQGVQGGGSLSWLPVAKLQRDLYQAVKSDPQLSRYPVWSISENGAETDNVGLQFLTIPAVNPDPNHPLLMPAGTKYADFANVHNYIYHPNSPSQADNKTWNAADPGPACKVDGLYGEYGKTWNKQFIGYSQSELLTLPRVTTETGCTIGGGAGETEQVHALNLLSMYLDQYKRGWSYTAVYLLRDRTDEGGNQQYGFYKPDYTPRKAAIYLHNLTTVLADTSSSFAPGKVDYAIPGQPATVHDLLLQKSNGTFELVVWNERVSGSDNITVNLGAAYPTVNVYDPTVGTTTTQVLANISSVPLTLSDHPMILEFSAVPEPATMGLLSILAVTACARRRRF